FPTPVTLLEGGERGVASGGIDGPVNVLQRCSDRFAVFVGDKIQAVAQQMNNASLDRGLRKDGGDRVGKPLQSVDDSEQHVLDATVLQLVHDAQPEFGAFVLLEPKPENLLGAVGAYAECDVHGLVAD